MFILKKYKCKAIENGELICIVLCTLINLFSITYNIYTHLGTVYKNIFYDFKSSHFIFLIFLHAYNYYNQ